MLNLCAAAHMTFENAMNRVLCTVLVMANSQDVTRLEKDWAPLP
jgi:hypothetical protein